ncbi:hypothetical protein [Luteimonas vadosa]|uniref:Uncharacterized protein n=1 Tax=Luteimonas vadosa TaxID=1165507 RepID=A0ABP9DX40_9GAMM
MSQPLILLLAAIVAIAFLLAAGLRKRSGRRHLLVSQVLDAADTLEARLRTARAEIEAIAGSDDNPMREAMQDMLRQRLWLQQHGQAATLDQLRTVRDALIAARRRIDQQLLEIERARAPLH